jgi:hypothetical protein
MLFHRVATAISIILTLAFGICCLWAPAIVNVQ